MKQLSSASSIKRKQNYQAHEVDIHNKILSHELFNSISAVLEFAQTKFETTTGRISRFKKKKDSDDTIFATTQVIQSSTSN